MYGSPSTGSSVRREEDVVRLQVAVDDAGRVRLRERARRLRDDLRHLGRGERPARDDRVRERLALEVLHDDVRQPLRAHAVVVDVDGVLRLELGRGACLDLEARPRLCLARRTAA